MADSQKSRFLWMKIFLVWSVILAGMFGTAEIVARIALNIPASPLEQMKLLDSLAGLDAFNKIFEFDDQRFWRLKEGLHDFRVAGDLLGRHLDFTINTNSSGMRVMQDAPCADGEAVRILALGDSCTFGFGVNDEEAWPNKLQQALNAKPGERCFKVFNAGVPAYTSFQCLQYLREKGLALKPNIVIAQFWINDQMPWGFGDYRIAKRLHSPIWLRGLSRSRFFQFLCSVVYGLNGRESPRLSPDEFKETTSELVDLCKQNGIRVVFAVWPSEQDWRNGVLGAYPAAVKKFAVDYGIPYADVLPAIHQKPGLWYVDACHASVAGNAVMADLLTPEILRLCL